MSADVGSSVLDTGELLAALIRFKKGDFSVRLPADGTGVSGKVFDVLNDIFEQNEAMAHEFARVSKAVGKEGRISQRASLQVGGSYADCVESVNGLISDLVQPSTEVARVIGAVAKGDLTQKMALEVDARPLRGEFLHTALVVNTMVDQLNAFAGEVTRVAREVGTEGKLGGQAEVRGVGGTWKDLTDSVNSMAGNLTAQVRNIAEVTTAVARGDLGRKITVDVRGEILELKNTINTMVDQLSSCASEVTRVAREVGTEGELGGQADVKGVAGVWKDLTESVNSMTGNLTAQVRNIAEVTTAVANGDLSRKITVDVRGEILEPKNTINTMVDQLNAFAGEVTRVAREVGTEGKLGGQAEVRGVGGTWKDLTDSVNSMAGNLTAQVRNIADVATAVAKGDLSTKITVNARGEIQELKNTINIMVDQLNAFAGEVTRVAREVGTEGVLGGQAEVRGVGGTWKDLTDSVNSMAGNLTAQLRNIAEVTTAVARGDLGRKITVDVRGEILELKNTINTMVDQLSSFASEVTRVAREVGTEGELGGQADVKGVAGVWKDLTDSVNSMAGNLTAQVRNIAEVTTAVANGNLSRKITVDVRGEILELKNTINIMVDQLNAFAGEVTRVAREVGTEGKLGGQAEVRGVGGTWKDLTDSVNSMAGNLTAQVRNIAEVTTAVANGDLSRKITVDVWGEIQELKNTINTMVDQLNAFAGEVTRVAREVGTEGKLGGQAEVPGAAGIWRALTDNVNQLAANLTTQVRAIADVATAVTKGDLTRSIAVEAQGEVERLKDTINQMIANLGETTRKNTDQDWLKTNIAKFTGMMQGQRDLLTVAKLLLSELTPLVGAHHGAFYIAESTDTDQPSLTFLSGYAFSDGDGLPRQLRMGEGLLGQCALEKQRILVSRVPENYIRIESSLGGAAPASIVVLPVLFEGESRAVIELASFNQFSEVHLAFLDLLTESIGIVLNTIASTMRTEELLKQSQALAEALQSQQLRLQQTNAELQEKAQLLAEQKTQVEGKNREVEQAKGQLEEKAEQLALTSRYKSEFLANMSHELRTPLNNLLILAKMLAENSEKNLLSKQVRFAETIHSSGTDLLALINDILDLAKIESGKMDVELGPVRYTGVRDYCAQTFRHVAEGKGLNFAIEVDPAVGDTMHTDIHRLQQVLKNLLSNALRFTERGSVKLQIGRPRTGWIPGLPTLGRAKDVVAFSVVDTGVGIPADKQKIIFEAFQQADGTTSRKYGGTGLGLSISRELARLLGGEIRLESAPGVGSTFTLYLPQVYVGGTQPRAEFQRTALQSAPKLPARTSAAGALGEEPLVEDDRASIQPGDAVLLIIEDDVTFARILVEMAHENELKALYAMRGNDGLALAREFKPGAITLDVSLPDTAGWTVLDRLKQDPLTRHIPVHMITGDDNRRRGLGLGASSYLQKAVTGERLQRAFEAIGRSMRKTVKKLLVVVESREEQAKIAEMIAGPDLEITAASTGAEALAISSETQIDGIVVDMHLRDSAVEFIEEVHTEPESASAPIILLGSREAEGEEDQLAALLLSGAVRYAPTLERLLDQTVLLLCREQSVLSESQRRVLQKVQRSDAVLAGSKVLVVDDDLRNIFALTSLLEHHDIHVISAENGRAGIELLKRRPDVDAILMDIMMPEMDGYETTRAIRAIPRFRNLPIIALTAKAMKGDRDKCLEAGASDYITKPVDLEQLFSVLRVWIARGQESSDLHSAPIRKSKVLLN
ncbi:MAG: HAMP domain-containing protein [Acidobacteriaceae bacterium]